MDLGQRKPWESCLYCHGVGGDIDDANIPSIAGQSARYIEKQLKDFRAGRRRDASGSMSGAVALLDPDEDGTVAAYFSRQQSKRPGDSLRPEDAGPGASLYWRGKQGVVACVACHPPRGGAAPFDYPFLEGMNLRYLGNQLLAFRLEQRSNDRGRVMHQAASMLDPMETDAVSRYLSNREIEVAEDDVSRVVLAGGLQPVPETQRRGGDR